mgnify:CR=1 FL=1
MTQTPKTIGVLALQGSFAEHITMLTRLGAKAVPVRSLTDVKKFDGLIIPGGESTTIMQLLDSTELKAWLVQFAKAGKPIYGTCAGMIVLANLGLIDIEVERNAYGPQLYSCYFYYRWSGDRLTIFGLLLFYVGCKSWTA